MTNKDHERRQYARYADSADVEIRIESAPAVPGLIGRIYMCRTSDISLRGACLLMDESIPKNTEIVMLIKLRQLEQRFRHRGRVVWCRDSGEKTEAGALIYHAGIEFMVSAGPEFSEWRMELLRLYEDA